MHVVVLIFSIINVTLGLTSQMPFFRGHVERIDPGEYLGEYGTKIDCVFKHEPIQIIHLANGTNIAEVDAKNMTNSTHVKQLVLRLKRLNGEDNSAMILNETELISELMKFPTPHSFGLVIAYNVEGSIPMNTLELMKSHVYECCLANRFNESESLCSHLHFIRPSKNPKNQHKHHQDVLSLAEFMSRNNTLYKVILVLLMGIFVLLIFTFILCIRFSMDSGGNNRRQRRRHQTAIRSISSSPELFTTVTVAGQAPIPSKIVGDLYARYNLNSSVVSVVEEDDCAPPPPYAEFVVEHNK